MPRAATFGTADERRHRRERHQITGGVIERLAWQRLRLAGAERFGFRGIEAACRLHERIEAAPRRPGPLVSVGAQRDINDAGPDFCDILRAEPERRNGVGPIALDENVGLAGQRRERVAPARVAQIDEGRQFSASGVDDKRRYDGRCEAVTSSTSAPCAASVRPHTGPAMMRVRSNTLTPASGRAAAARGFGRRAADAVDGKERQVGDGASLRMFIPLGKRPAGGNDEAGLRRRGFEILGFPSAERALYRGAVVVAAKQPEHVAVVRQPGVKPHPAAVPPQR